MKQLEIHPEAQAEAKGSFDYLLVRSRSAAVEFNKELRLAYRKLLTTPHICSPYLHGTRRALVNRYPFSVVFRERLHDIQIVAVAHAKRRPGYWAKRMNQ